MADQSPPAAAEGATIVAELAEALADALYALQVLPELRFEYLSGGVTALVGYTPEEHYADPGIAERIATPAGLVEFLDRVASAPDGPMEFTQRSTARDGRTIWAHHRCLRQTRPDGSVVLYGAARDVTDQMEAEAALARSQAEYRLLAENASDVVWRSDLEARIEWVSPSVASVLGWSREEMLGTRILDHVHPDDLDRVQRATSTANDGDRVSFSARYQRKDGDFRWLAIVATPVLDADGRVIGKVGSCRDVHGEILARQEADSSHRLMRLAMSSAPAGMALVDLGLQITEANPALARMLSCDTTVLSGCRIPELLHPEDEEIDASMRAEVLSGRAASALREVRMRTRDGRVIWVQHGIGLLRDDDGTPLSYVSQFVDVTEARRAREELEHLAGHDALTGLANRRRLMEWMEPILSHAGRGGSRLAVLYLDLDGLKAVNDTWGHGTGDLLIAEAARRIRHEVREDDLAARLGGDEFVVGLPTVGGLAQALLVAGKLQRAIGEPYLIEGRELRVTVSIGIALAAQGDEPARVLQHADIALYQAKKGGRDRIEVFGPAL